MQRKIDAAGLCRPDMTTDQDLHCLPFILSNITHNIIPIRCYGCNMTADLTLHYSHVTNARFFMTRLTLRKHAYSNILKILPPKFSILEVKFSDKKSLIFFTFLLKKIDCG